MFLTNKTSFVNFVDTFPKGESKKITCPKANIAFVLRDAEASSPTASLKNLQQGKYNCR